MKHMISISSLLILMMITRLQGQEHDVVFSGKFIDVPFLEFTREVEKQTGITFYYLEDWVREIRVTASGDSISLKRTLDRTILPADLQYYLDGSKQVYITDDIPIVFRLPEYAGVGSGVDGSLEITGQDGITSTEKKYIDGRKVGQLETIRVGSNDQGNSHSNYVIRGKITDVETGEPLIGATIYVEELKRGAATDVDGRFSMVLRPGKYTVVFNCMGMETRHHYLEVLSGGTLIIPMEKGFIPLTEVVIRADRYHNPPPPAYNSSAPAAT